jgi:hypothetical protein
MKSAAYKEPDGSYDSDIKIVTCRPLPDHECDFHAFQSSYEAFDCKEIYVV